MTIVITIKNGNVNGYRETVLDDDKYCIIDAVKYQAQWNDGEHTSYWFVDLTDKPTPAAPIAPFAAIATVDIIRKLETLHTKLDAYGNRDAPYIVGNDLIELKQIIASIGLYPTQEEHDRVLDLNLELNEANVKLRAPSTMTALRIGTLVTMAHKRIDSVLNEQSNTFESTQRLKRVKDIVSELSERCDQPQPALVDLDDFKLRLYRLKDRAEGNVAKIGVGFLTELIAAIDTPPKPAIKNGLYFISETGRQGRFTDGTCFDEIIDRVQPDDTKPIINPDTGEYWVIKEPWSD